MPPAPRPGLQEAVRLGHEMYESRVLPQLRPEDHGRFVVVEIRTGEYEIDESECAAINRLRERCPSGEFYLARVGYRAAHKFGWRGTYGRAIESGGYRPL